MSETQKIDIAVEAVQYAYELMHMDDKSPEMVTAITGLLSVIMNYS